MSCPDELDHTVIRIALAGNPNVGKSVIFNQLTGLSQVIGNWPGKTVEKAEGRAHFGDYIFNIIDLPGIYSLSTYSLEEIVTREYIVEEKPDFIINVIDANHLERNLFLTFQLMMLGRPMIISLNQYDLLQARGYRIDVDQLEKILGIPIVQTVAVHNRGVHELLETIIKLSKQKLDYRPMEFSFGREIEPKIQQVQDIFGQIYTDTLYPPRFAAIKLVENDEKCIEHLHLEKYRDHEQILQISMEVRSELEQLHGEPITTIFNAEIFSHANQITSSILTLEKPSKKQYFANFIDHLTIHSVFGYVVLFGLLLSVYAGIFNLGNLISNFLSLCFTNWTPAAVSVLGGTTNWVYIILWESVIGGLIAAIGGVLPYVIPFYFFIEILQDIGYLPRAAYLMDKFMHAIGVHGKSIIPILLGFGCNVPAVAACAIMETEREKKRAIFLSSMIPCSARTTIILGLVAKYVGWQYAMLLYIVDFIVVIIIGKMLSLADLNKETELIIELHDFRVPNFKVILIQTWNRSKEFVIIALPLIVVLGIGIQILAALNILGPINFVLSPVIVAYLGLPIGVGIFLFYGVFRKELNLILLALYVASLGLTMAQYMTPIQMIVFTLTTMLYAPCAATIVMIKKETSSAYAWEIFFVELGIAIIFAGAIRWIYVFLSVIAGNLSDFMIIALTFTIFLSITIGFIILLSRIKNHLEKKANKTNSLCE